MKNRRQKVKMICQLQKKTFKCNTIGVMKKVIINNPKASFIYNKNIKDTSERNLYYIAIPLNEFKEIDCSTSTLPPVIEILDDSIADSNYTGSIVETLLNKNIKDKDKKYNEEKKKNTSLYSDDETRNKVNKELLEEHTKNITTLRNIYKSSS